MSNLIRSYDRYAEERDQIGLDNRKRSHVQEAIRVFSDNDVKSILIICADGLFVLGLWGGEDFEGVWENDRYEPARFFCCTAKPHCWNC